MQSDNLTLNLRVLAGYARSISEICRGAKVNRTQFHRYLAGEALPGLRSLRRICDYFGVEESEILMDASAFREMIRIRPPQLGEASDPLDAIRGRLFASDASNPITMGLYHMTFCPEVDQGLFYRLLLRLSLGRDGVMVKLIERYPRSGLPLPGIMKSEGAGFMRQGKFYSMTQEVKHRRSTWATVMNVGDFAAPRTLHGLTVGSEPEGNVAIQSFPVVWTYLGERPNLRQALGDCGYFSAAEIKLPPELEAALTRR